MAYMLISDKQVIQSGKSGTIRELNQASGVCKAHYALYFVLKSSIFLAKTGVRIIGSVACGFSPIEIHLISRINDFYCNILLNFIYNHSVA